MATNTRRLEASSLDQPITSLLDYDVMSHGHAHKTFTMLRLNVMMLRENEGRKTIDSSIHGKGDCIS